MEVATIDWKDSKFEKDELYEHINAPQWIDLTANPPLHHDDDAWFCRPDCNHPKTADDFFIKPVPSSSKLQRPANVSEIPTVDDQNQSNTPMKKRGIATNKTSRNTKHVQDNENQNPNVLLNQSTQKKTADNGSLASEETPRRLKSTFSARNLFAGNNILNQITGFCNELKRLATRSKQRVDEEEEKQIEQKKPDTSVLKEREIQRKPLLEATKVKDEDMVKSCSNGKDKLRRKMKMVHTIHTKSVHRGRGRGRWTVVELTEKLETLKRAYIKLTHVVLERNKLKGERNLLKLKLAQEQRIAARSWRTRIRDRILFCRMVTSEYTGVVRGCFEAWVHDFKMGPMMNPMLSFKPSLTFAQYIRDLYLSE